MLRVKSPQDLGAAIVFIVISLAGLFFGKDLTFGTASQMGPGFFPTWLNFAILAIGIATGVKALSVDGPSIERFQIRPILFIVVAIAVFAILINTVGLALSAMLMTIFAAYARRTVKVTETILLAVGLAIFSVIVFVYMLGQAVPAWWGL
ncbi:MAG TPA: tripartite tricarboxylate transporter TctB family protein [Syntrophorhabdales bacterium]|nr:tripartite tricarboxylate transporter TctB family protein [Syntrophorhabdales bacterium]